MASNKRRGFGNIRKLPSGRYQVSFISPDGVRVTGPTTFKFKVDAESYLALKRIEIEDKAYVPDLKEKHSNITFSKMADRHISLQNTRAGQTLKPATKEHYGKLLRKQLKPFLERPVASITKTDVDDWWISVTKAGKRTSASKAYKLLSAVMKRAVSDGIISVNPCAVSGAQTAITGKEIVCPTPVQVANISRTIGGNLGLMVLLMAYGGLRFGEATELRRNDIAFVDSDDGGYFALNVARAVVYVEKTFIVGTPKSKQSSRSVALTSALNEKLLQFIEDFDKTGSKNSLLFPSPANSRVHMRNDTFARQVNKAKRELGLERSGITPHSFRHFAGTYFAAGGANLSELKEWLGDSSTAAVQRYLHPVGRNPQLANTMPLDEGLFN